MMLGRKTRENNIHITIIIITSRRNDGQEKATANNYGHINMTCGDNFILIHGSWISVFESNVLD